MSDSSSVQLYYVEETVWGQVPTSGGSPEAPQLNEFRFTNDDLTQTTETAISEEIRSDRQTADIIRTQVSAAGEVGAELSYGSHDDLIAGAFADNWSTEINEAAVTGTLSSNSPGPGLFTLGSSPLPSPNFLLNVEVGMWLRFTAAAAPSPEVDDFYQVVAVNATAGTIQLDRAPAQNHTGTFAIRGQFLRNGTTRKSFTIEKDFSDALDENTSPGTEVLQYFTGMRVGSMNLNIAPGAIINGSFTFEGKQAFSASATIGDGSPATVSTDDVMSAVDNITDIEIDGAPASAQLCFTNIEFTLDNSLRAQPCIGQLANSGIGLGRTVITGTLEAYLEDRDFIEKYLNFTTFGLSFRATLGSDSYIFEFPSIKLTSGGTPTPGNDQDVLVSVEFTAKRDPVKGYMIGLTRIPAGTA